MADKTEFSPIQIDEEVTIEPKSKTDQSRRRLLIVVSVVCVIVLLIIAFIVGYFVRRVPNCETKKPQQHQPQTNVEELYKEAIEGMSAARIEKELKYFTDIPHIGGSNVSYQQALYIQKKWKEFGFDKVELKLYNILLSYPERPGKASVVTNNGSALFTAQRREKILEPAENHSDVVPPLNAYSASGNVTAQLIYVNYARREDFQALKDMNISCAGHIVIAKYGKIFRGDKAKFAAGEGAVGLILYTDPADYSPEGADNTYPKSWWLPPTGVQRGTLYIRMDGDPLTPGYPSVEGIYRKSVEAVKQSDLPSIPVYPISYSDASHFLRCKCGNCNSQYLQNPNEFQCCAEIEECVECLSSEMVLEEVGTKPSCVTLHPGFFQVCLQRWSLRLAADKYKTKDKVKYRQTGSENSILTKTEAPKDWFGDLSITYYIQMAPGDMRNVNLDVAMKLEVKPVYNVIGVMDGAIEPDRLVLLGNHRDAWIFGAADPSSATATLMETARAMGEIKKKGWKPRRSVVLCSWGAEEYGLMGSTEWGEEFTNLLSNRAVAYLNVDISVQGNYSLRAKTSPLLDFVLFEAAKKIPRPGASSPEDSVYKEWKTKRPDKKDPRIPYVSKVGSGSDYALLYHRLGVPSVDFRYTFEAGVSSYPVYHSVHDSFHWMKYFVDRDFLYHRAVAQLWLQLSVLLTDSVILPLNCTRYAQRLVEYAADIDTRHRDTLKEHNITLEFLSKSVSNFAAAAKKFTSFIESVDKADVMKVRMVNDRLMQLEKSFVNPQGLPGRPYERHVVFAPSASNQYAGSSFPGLVDALYNVQYSDEKDWDAVEKQLSDVVFYIRAATNVMTLTSL